MTIDTSSCLDCVYQSPPDAILSIPPPPLPSFLLPKSSDLILPGNNHSQPCFAAFMCETSLGGINSDHIEYIELPRNPNLGIDEPWFFVLLCILCAVLFISAVLSIILLKCRDNSCSYHENNLKSHQMTFSRDRDTNANPKTHGYVVGNGQLMPAYNPPLPVLWATLTPHGTTQHFVSEPYPQENHYEAVDYNRKAYQACVNDLNKTFTHTPKKTMTIKSNKGPFENSGFVDFEDYADPSPLIGESGLNSNMDNEEIDSGISGEYQDPHQFSLGSSNADFLVSNGSINSSHIYSRGSPSTLNRQRMISTPTRIANPNNVIPPLNSRTLAKNIKNATMSHQSPPVFNKRISSSSLSRRTLDQ